VHTNEAEGFFPEREVLRARRLKSMGAESDAPSKARAQRSGIWMTLAVAVFLPMFVNMAALGWDHHVTPGSVKVVIFALRLVLAGCVAAVAVGIWRSLPRAKNPSG
jgi:hypothetical protein